MYMSAPLPFMGQKRMFAKEFIKVLGQYPDGTTFVDLFGGSGLLSHIAKCQKPNSKVVYNDFDGYQKKARAYPANERIADRTTKDSHRNTTKQANHGRGARASIPMFENT